ncbi:MBL fold metallo-hydrolase [Nitriliruptor alkaliphilus]|uniref:MBL fold metallo-hydrolase n=1 Tax=Nitriliruptor alkaliphilus TaxID=427918 RepID=UPI0006991D9B|nr:MBL fold metallo-hydrolase [Nitriliruptor alkaliphilus]
MKVTKYPQSCLVVETSDGARLLIDPGEPFTAHVDVETVFPLDGVLVTHRHADHLDAAAARRLLERGIPLFSGADVATALADHEGISTVAGGQLVTVAEVSVQVFDLPHMPMVDGTPGPPNLGFLVDERLLHPGDSKDVVGLVAEVLAVPIAGPSLSSHDAYRMVRSVRASAAIPIHYELFPGDPRRFEKWARDIARIRVLANGETATF